MKITLTIFLVLFLTGCSPEKIINLATFSEINSMEYSKELENIKKELDVADTLNGVKIEGFSLIFDDKGDITNFAFDLIEKNNGFFLHRISFSPEKDIFLAKTQKIEEWGQYEQLVDAKIFFEALTLLNLNSILPRLTEYRVISPGTIINYIDVDKNNYMITSNGLEELPESSLPIKSFYFFTSWDNQYLIYPIE